MVKRYRDLTEKYKSFRLQPDAVYQSRTIQTLFNKFTVGGEKKTARKFIFTSIQRLRYTLRRPTIYRVLLRLLKSLRVQFILVAKREGKKIIDVPVPVRRNKRDIMNIQVFANAVRKRQDRLFSESLLQELTTLTLKKEQSPTLRQLTLMTHKVYDERTNMEKR
jgi:ribosomal protein S7